jgi:hypothetical protein
MFPSPHSAGRSQSARQSALTTSGSVHQADMYYRLARPPERLTAVPIREFTVGAASTDPRLRTSRARPAYDPLRDPHLASFWARHSMLPDVRRHDKQKKRSEESRMRYRSDLHRARCEERIADDLAALAAKRYASAQRHGHQDAITSPPTEGGRNTTQQPAHSTSPPREHSATGQKQHKPSPPRQRHRKVASYRGNSATSTTMSVATATLTDSVRQSSSEHAGYGDHDIAEEDT